MAEAGGESVSKDVKIAVDAMGGDDAPDIVIDGCAIALERNPNVHFLLFGDETKIKPLLEKHEALAAASEIHHTPDAVPMDAKPAQAVRQGRKSSMAMAITAVKVKRAQAVVSAGSTGALMAMSLITLRTFPGVSRPAIAAMWPTMTGETLVLDVGANVEASIKQLVDFAVLGEAFAHAVMQRERPKVGLLNVGSEDVKGNEIVKAADALLRAANLPMDYVGYVEGDEISSGKVDVIVTDGFSGNIALKTAEGTARLVGHYLRTALRSSLLSKIGALLASGAFGILREKMDPRSVNGGVFLGLNGLVVKSHGGTDGLGFASALDLAIELAGSNFTDDITQALDVVNEKVDAAEAALRAEKESKREAVSQ